MSAAHATTLKAPQLPETMRAIKKLQPAPGLSMVHDLPLPKPGVHDVLVKVTHVGVCGTDRHIFEWDHWSASRVPIGVTVGHEFVGRIVQLGSAVEGFTLGERVSGEGHLACGHCKACRTGSAHICDHVDILGIDCDGAFADYVKIPASNLWRVDNRIPDTLAAVYDPLGNAMHTVMAAGVSGKSVLITGAGIIGLMAVAIAHTAGAGTLLVTDPDPRRRKIALDLGADAAFASNDPDWIAQARQMTHGQGPDVLLEMSGHPTAITDGLACLRNGATAALLGLPADPVAIDLPRDVIFKGTTLLGINGRLMFETWFQVENLLLSGRVNLDPILTHTLPFDDFATAFALMQKGDAIKVVLKV